MMCTRHREPRNGNRAEPSAHRFLAEGSDKRPSAQHLRPNLQPIYHYEGTLKVEYKAVTLSRYTVELQEDRRHLKEVSRPRLAETPFRSAQLTLFDLGPDQWLLFWHMRPYALSHRTRQVKGLVQPPLLEVPPQEKAVGADQPPVRHPWLHPVPKASEGAEGEE
jgi:hypothetical protein